MICDHILVHCFHNHAVEVHNFSRQSRAAKDMTDYAIYPIRYQLQREMFCHACVRNMCARVATWNAANKVQSS